MHALPSPFQRDRDRLVRSAAFRRLAGKTQVVAAPDDPLLRTRLTHTLEVADLARSIARGLAPLQLDGELVEVVALAHDIGHPAFGHAGERALARIVPGGFHHAAHGARLAAELEPDLHLSPEVVSGILHHSKGKDGPVFARGAALGAVRAEALVVRAADLYAYASHDLDDAYALGALRPEDLPRDAVEVLGASPASVARALVGRTVEASLDAGTVTLDVEGQAALGSLRRFLYDRLYEAGPIARQSARITEVVEGCWAATRAAPDLAARALGRVGLAVVDEMADVPVWFVRRFAALTDAQALRVAADLGAPAWGLGDAAAFPRAAA
jgi:dGTPase